MRNTLIKHNTTFSVIFTANKTDNVKTPYYLSLSLNLAYYYSKFDKMVI